MWLHNLLHVRNCRVSLERGQLGRCSEGGSDLVSIHFSMNVRM